MQVCFLLVEPSVPANIGAAARAIKTMSFNELRLVNPCSYLSGEAIILAHGSSEILQTAKVFESFSESIADIDFVIGTTAKHRRVKQDYYPVFQLADIISAKGQTISSLGIVFGREESGLSNDELRMCDLVSYVPMGTTYPSLNLSHAVMIYAYELFRMNLQTKTEQMMKSDRLTYNTAKNTATEILSRIGVSDNQTLFNRIIEKINIMSEDDLHLLYSICKYFNKYEKS